jgi:uncharacterized membrane protein YfcA
MLDPITITIVAITFLLAGLVKGVIGLGLPTISLGLLVATFDLTTAMALLIMPSLLTNLWQAFSGGSFKKLLQRLWPFLLMASLTVWLGSTALTKIDLWVLSMLLGGLLVTYALLSLSGFRFAIRETYEPWAGILLGIVNGILTGMTGSFAVPGVMYLQGIGLSRDQLVQAMGMLFSVSTIALAIALQRHNFLTGEISLVSAIAVLPALLGMWFGQRLRQKLSEQGFRQVFFVSILLLGVYIIFKSYPG